MSRRNNKRRRQKRRERKEALMENVIFLKDYIKQKEKKKDELEAFIRVFYEDPK